MSEPSRPWWASDPVADEVDRSVDPIEAHRAARRAWLGPNAPTSGPDAACGDPGGASDGPRTAGGPGGASDGPRAADGPGGAADGPRGTANEPVDHAAQICGVCPVCVLARTVGESRPELLGHLAEAARHLSAAARSFLEPHAATGVAEAGSADDPTAATEEPLEGTSGEDHASAARRRHAGRGRAPQRIDLDP